MRISVFQLLRKIKQSLFVLFERGSSRSLFGKNRTLVQFSPQIQVPSPILFGVFNLPRLESVFPCLDCVFVLCVLNEATSSLPSIVFCLRHRRLMPIGLFYFAPFQHNAELIMAILGDIGRYFSFLSNDSFDRKATAVNTRLHVFDHNDPFQGSFFCAHECEISDRSSVRDHGAFGHHNDAVSDAVVFNIHVRRFTIWRDHDSFPNRAFLSIMAPSMWQWRPASVPRLLPGKSQPLLIPRAENAGGTASLA